MNAGSGHRSPLQLHRFKNRHRIDQPCPGRTPLDFQQRRLLLFIRPFERERIPRKFRRSAQGFPVCDIIINHHQTVRRKIVFHNLGRKILHRLIQRIRGHNPVFHRIKALLFQPFHLTFHRIVERLSFGAHQRERHKPHMTSRCDLIVQLAHGTAAQISRILVLCIHILDFLVDLLKIRVCDDRLSTEYQFPLKRNSQRNIFKNFCIVCHDLSDQPVSSRHGFLQTSIPVGKDDGQSIHFPGEQALLVPDKLPEHFHILGFIQRKHRAFVGFFRQFIDRFIPHLHRRTVCQHGSGLFLQFHKFVIEPVVIQIAHDLPVFLIIGLCRLIQKPHQLFHSLCLIHMLPPTTVSPEFCSGFLSVLLPSAPGICPAPAHPAGCS